MDWRFLLPEIAPARALVAADAALTEAVGAIAKEVTRLTADAGTGFDLAVLQDPGPDSLRAAYAALKPGGSLYVEWTTRQPSGTPAGRLRAAGFEAIERYWPWPSVDRLQAWLPLDALHALRHFVSQRPPAQTPAAQAARLAFQALLATGQQALAARPLCAIARRPGADGPPAPLAQVRAAWERWPQMGAAPRRLDWLLLTSGTRSENKLVALVFADGAEQPSLAIKMPRVEEALEPLRAEAARLESMPPKGLPGVPQLLFSGELAGRWMLIETALNGQPVFAHLRPATLRPIALQATDWLAALAGRPAPSARAEWWPSLAAPALDDFEHAFGPVAAPEHLAATRALLDTLGGLPLVCEHGDFEPWNVRRAADGSLAVLDWETAKPSGLPAVDLIYFLTYLALSLDGALDSESATRAGYRALLDPQTPSGALFAECLARYAEQVGLAPAALRPLRRLTWLRHCRWEYVDLARDAGRAPTPEQLRRSLFFRLWQEDCALS